MECCVRDDKRIVEIWLTKAEKEDPAVAESLKPVYREYTQRKYTVVVFQSGDEDLWENTSALLIRNRNLQAHLEVQKEKENQMQIIM